MAEGLTNLEDDSTREIEIAIIGMACKLPGGNNNPDDFWKFLKGKKSGIKEVPADRWSSDLFYDPDPKAIASSVSKWAGFVDGIDHFDARFFGISPREAASMDPQQRMVLQGTYEALQDTNIPVEQFSEGSTGVYVGISQSDFRSIQEMRLTNAEAFAGTGFALCVNANRVSHRLNLTGPSSAIDTACSSSLVALDQAVKALITGECDVAVAAGVNSLIHPSSFIAFSKAGMLSPTGRISTFDKAANGFVRGEGFGAVVLKPLDAAQRDGDRIHAVIRSTHVNQDGFTSTITAPNQESQMSMLEELINKSGIPREHIGYVEAHGTGTPVGDPIEAGAIGQVIGQSNPSRPVYIGSVKANIGHLESAAGIAGLIKATMAVKSGEIPPNANFKEANPFIPLDALNLKVPTKVESFPDVDGNCYAVVNSFGFGGTNASVLISSAPKNVQPKTQTPSKKISTSEAFPLFFPISGVSPEMIVDNAKALLKQLGVKGRLASIALQDISAALAQTRSHLGYRTVILARNETELKSNLRKLIAGKEDVDDIVSGQVQDGQKICFMFSGQGSQSWNMARSLIESNKVFSDTLDAYDTHFQKASGWSIRAELLKDQETSRIDDTTVTQPALFAIQASLAALWAQFGVKPDMTVGHSIGEAAASYVAGGLPLDDAAKFLNKRGAIRDQLGIKGGMAAVGLNHADVEPMLPGYGKIGIAAINGPGSTTISGDYDAVVDFVKEFEMQQPDTFIRLLTVDTAWHSYHLDNGEDWFRSEMTQIDWSVPHTPFISSVTGKMETRFDLDYGWLNLRQPVLFQKGVEAALALGATTFVELGPHSTLMGPASSTALEKGARVNTYSSISRKGADFDVFARCAAKLFVLGHDLDWAQIAPISDALVELPKTVWAQTEFHKDSEESRDILNAPAMHPFLGMRAMGASTTWKSEINLGAYPYLKEHRLQADAIFPAAAYIDTIIAGAHEVFGAKAFEIKDATIHDALFIDPDKDVLLSVTYSAERGKMEMYSRVRDSREEWILRADAFVFPTDVKQPRDVKFDPNDDALHSLDVSLAYDVDGNDEFINYGDAFQAIKDLWMTKSKTTARVIMTDGAEATFDKHYFHPTMLDACLQITDPRMTLSKIEKGRQPGDPAHLPVGVRRVRYYAPFPKEIYVHAKHIKGKTTRDSEGGFVVTDKAGKVLMTMDGLMMRILPTKENQEAGTDVVAHYVTEKITRLRDDITVDAAFADGHYILLADPSSKTNALVKNMSQQGAKVSVLNRENLGSNVEEGITDAFGDALEKGRISGVIYAFAAHQDDLVADCDTQEIFGIVEAHTKALVSLGSFMDYHRSNEIAIPRIYVLTKHAYPDAQTSNQALQALSQAPLVAIARGLATETPEYSVRVIDCDEAALSKPDRLAASILSSTPETELLLRGTDGFAPRLSAVEKDDFDPKILRVSQKDDTINFHATMRSPGVIDDLELQEIPMESMSADQVRVRISAVGLNFRDIMAVTALLPEEAEPDPAWQNLGLEFGGEVIEVGSNITGYKAGDRVMGLGRRCLQRYMSIDPKTLTLLPDHISLEEAATIPSAFATAHYTLNRVGRLAKGERVLIHVATGGVGTAAVQLAHAVGAEIFATAGSPQKRAILKEQGVHHIMDSRSLQFADDVERLTKGQGVDVLLNSLPGDYITKGLEIMAPYGRYLEIGKRDVYEDKSIGMKALRRNVSVSVLDLAAMGNERPDLLADMFGELVERFESRELTPLPVTSFPVSKITDAFRYMSQAKHVGKVVVSLEDDEFLVRRDPNRAFELSQDGSYLITGGTKGFSLSIADWMSRNGAGRLILASRTAKLAPREEKTAEKMRARGTIVDCCALDVTSSKDVHEFVANELTGDRPLRGVIHGAAVIKDGFANQLTDDMICDVLRPKVSGGWNLHQAFEKAGIDPDFMIGFSSVAQVIGSGGQANYVAANAFLDALGHYRRNLGLSGSAIDWGVIAQSGFVARNKSLSSYLDSVGLQGLKTKETYDAMETMLTKDTANFVYSKADWAQVARANASHGNSPRFEGLLRSSEGGNQEVRARLLSLEGDDLMAAISDFIQDEVCNVLKVEKSVIQTSRPMSDLGLDSLSSFELKMRLETMLDFTLPISKFLQGPSIDELTEILREEIDVLRIQLEADAERLASGESIETDGDSVQKTEQALADHQLGSLRNTTALMTSETARRAFQHDVEKDVPLAVSQKDIKVALGKLMRRHPLLRLSTDFATDAPTQSFKGAGPTIMMEISTEPLAVSEGELSRICARVGENRTTLCMSIHAAIADSKSANLAMKELCLLLTDAVLNKAPKKSQLTDFLNDITYEVEDPTSQNDRAFMWYSMAKGASPVEFPYRSRPLVPVELGRDHGPAKHIEGSLKQPFDADKALISLAGALRQVTGGQGDVLMNWTHDLRASGITGDLIAPLTQNTPIVVPSQVENKVSAAKLARVLQFGAQHTRFDTYAAARYLNMHFEEWGVNPFQIEVKFDGSLDIPNVNITHDLALHIDVTGGAHKFRLSYDTDVLDEKLANEIVDAFVQQFQRAF